LSLGLALLACSSSVQPTAGPTIAAVPTAAASPAVERSPRFTDDIEGYSFRFPGEFNVVVYGRSMCLTVADDTLMKCHVANGFVDVTEAGGQTLAEAADAIAAQANPDIPVQRSEIAVGGEPAIQLDDIYAADVYRKVVVLHGDRLYVLTFVPWSESAEGFPRVEKLYESILSTFEFPQAGS
jgi:hypothetical protein